jgi:hypothetical protein
MRNLQLFLYYPLNLLLCTISSGILCHPGSLLFSRKAALSISLSKERPQAKLKKRPAALIIEYLRSLLYNIYLRGVGATEKLES